MKKIIIIVVSVVLILSAITCGAMYYMGNKFLNSMIDSQLSSIIEEEVGDALDEPQGDVVPEGNDSGSDAGGVQNNDSATGPEQNSTEEKPLKEDGGSADSGGNGTVKNPAKGSEPTGAQKSKKLTAKEIQAIKDSVTFQDKMEASALVFKRLTTEDLNEIKRMVSGGITAEEAARAKALVYSRFTEEEIERIKELYEKYMRR